MRQHHLFQKLNVTSSEFIRAATNSRFLWAFVQCFFPLILNFVIHLIFLNKIERIITILKTKNYLIKYKYYLSHFPLL